MVISGEGGDREAGNKLIAMGTERSKPPLHNFSMPCLRWGSQRFLRCVKENPSGGGGGEGFDRAAEKVLIGRRKESFKKSEAKAKSGGDDGIEAVREKLMSDLQTAADKMKFAILGEGLKEPPAAEAAESARPWNLRTRRAACKAPNGTNGGIGAGGDCGGEAKSLKIAAVRKPNFSPSRTESKSPSGGEKRQRAKFSVALSRREIEEDFMRMAGHRPHRRPKKRPRVVQKQLDALFPGLWLTEVTADIYQVADAS